MLVVSALFIQSGEDSLSSVLEMVLLISSSPLWGPRCATSGGEGQVELQGHEMQP